MVDLIFFTTNRTKISHFRYIGSKSNIHVKSFQEANYYASYLEPRINDRAELLRLSYESALSQWMKRQKSSTEDSTTFFFEDTSVRIDALSTIEETPGVNIKFWMKGMSFEKLDGILKEHGNNRRASVRSDIILHLPHRWRQYLGVTKDYIWVHGETTGSIVGSEVEIEPNLIYPWLDNRSFNRWFVPDGALKPLSALEISDADQFDFRGRAFEKVVEVFKQLRLAGQSPSRESCVQLELPEISISPSVLVICGPTCAGKTTAATWLNDSYGIQHFEASDFMYKAFWDRHGVKTQIKIGDFAEAALKSTPQIVAHQIAKHLRDKQILPAVVTGFRASPEIESFIGALGPGIGVRILYLDAPYKARFERAVLRGRDDVTPEKFEKRNCQEVRMGLLDIAQRIDVIQVQNNSTIRALNSRLKRKLGQDFMLRNHVLRFEKKQSTRVRNDGGLEPLIVLTLFELNDPNSWMNTTEIADAIQLYFGIRKHKTNVSRYFNQEFHSYFEARVRGGDGRRMIEYRLSSTGVSFAKALKITYSNRSSLADPRKLQTRMLQYELPLGL